MTFCDLTICNDNPLLIRLCTELGFFTKFLRGFPRTFATDVAWDRDLHLFYCWDQRHPISIRHFTSLWHNYRTWHFTESDISPDIGFHIASAKGVACRQGALTPPDTWSRPFGTCICSTCRDQSLSKFVVILPDYALRISLGTFSILLVVGSIADHMILFVFWSMTTRTHV